MKTEEYFKITNLKEYLLVLEKEDRLKWDVTRSEENDVISKIKLMQEAEKFGREEAQKFFKDAVERSREKLADLEHKQWMFWSKNIINNEKISEDRLDKWAGLWIDYSKLKEKDKESDRVWADEVIKELLLSLDNYYNDKTGDTKIYFANAVKIGLIQALQSQKEKFKDVIEDRFQQIRVDLEKSRLTVLQLAEREQEILKVLEEK